MGDSVGRKFGNYRLIRLIGRGSLTEVYLGEHINLGTKAAIKVLYIQLTSDDVEMFRNEIRAVAYLRHPHLVRILDFGVEDGVPFLVMDYVPNGTLRQQFPKGTQLSPSSIVPYVKQVASALQYIHHQGLIYRNIKPENLLLGQNNEVLLEDCLELVAQGSSLLDGQEMVGTVGYMAPEQFQGEASPASDQYALGIVVYEWLSGYRPFRGPLTKIVNQHMLTIPSPLHEKIPVISLEVEEVVLIALAKDPRQRFASVQAFATAFEQASRQAQPGLVALPLFVTPQGQSPYSTRMDIQSSQFLEPAPMGTLPGQSPQPLSETLPQSQHTLPTYRPVEHKLKRSRLIPISMLLLAILISIGSLGAVFFRQGSFGPGLNVRHTSLPTQQSRRDTSNTIPSVGGRTVTPMLTTLTTCPGPGSAHAAVMPPLILGNAQNIVYIANGGTLDSPTFGAVERRDVTNGSQSVEIIKIPQAYITEAHISQDGQWVLFILKVAGQFELRMVRIDGQGLQTLLCVPLPETIFGTQWTFDQKVVVFDEGGQSGPSTTYLLDITNGKLQPELVPSSTTGYKARLWLSSTKLYMVGFEPDSDATNNIYILDTKNGPNQHDSNLQQVTSVSKSCVSFDSSYDNNLLFLSQCTGGFDTQQGPSSLTIQLAAGSIQNTIYSNSTLAITTVRVVAPTTLLLLIENTTGDTSQNGLWKINTDGTQLTRLTSDNDGSQGLCPFSQYSWSNLSRDGTMYALQLNNSKTNTYGMAYGSLNGGPLTQFALSRGTVEYLVGWTTL